MALKLPAKHPNRVDDRLWRKVAVITSMPNVASATGLR